MALSEGENRLIARVTDGLGNQGAHTRVVYRDTVAPELAAADPAGGALAVPPGAAFALTFRESMAEPSAGAWRLELADATPVAATATLAGDTLTVRPDADLASEADLRLVLTAALTDLAGNALDTPPTLVYTVADVEAPPAPALAATPPAYLCASSITLAGSAEPEGMVEATGGAAAASVRAAADGSFSLTVLLRPAALNHVEVTARDVDGNRSPATVVEVVADCVGPSVVETEMVGETFTVVFDEAVAAASLGVTGAIAVSDVSGPVAGTVAATAADAAVFTPDAALSGGPFRFVVSAAVTDLAGNPLAFPYSEVFGAGVETSFLAGRVVDAATGRPLDGARVVVATLDGVPTSDPRPEQTTTDDGRFRIPVPPGTHSLVVGRDGYTPVYRVVTSTAGYGADVFDPRLTPAAEAVTIGTAGGDFGTPSAPSLGPALEIPSTALAADAEVAVTALDEQALPALLPYGWSPRGAAWVDLGGATLASAATLAFPVDAADGTSLVVASLDPVTLQWTARAEVTVFDGAVTTSVGDTQPGEGAWAAVEPDLAPTAPPEATVGSVLGSATAPVGDEATAATIVFNPAQVLPAQSSLATVTYTLATDAASGLAVTVTVRETLTLLDGTVRTGAPYDVDAVVYRAADGTPRSRFRLRPSAEASRLPIELGAEDVSVRLYAGETVRGNVLGPLGGTVTNPEGDSVVVPAGGLPEPTAVLIARLAQGDLATTVPTGFDFLGLVDLDLSGRALSAPAALTLELGAAPGVGEEGLLFQVIDLGAGAGPQLRPVAELSATASGWTTATIDAQDL
ncbi:MAG TPA: Ig-like domain-containing domain, partial [Thermoanaerobaculia bacterium]|nr:Ig-like domain-containing domain [Thermoanaerobaculia bacterium]